MLAFRQASRGLSAGSIPDALSVYLDLLRLLAALIVFVHHASYPRFGGEWLVALSGFGHEAVVVFFVLSGFVIAHTIAGKRESASGFAANRLARLWSVAVPAVALTVAMDLVGSHLAPGLYANLLEPVANALPSLLFVNEFWFAHRSVGSNIPLWSLSFEAAYYLLFGFFVFSRHRLVTVPLVAMVVGPKILLLLPAWLFGVVAYAQVQRSRSTGMNLVLASLGAALAGGLALTKFGNLYVTWRVQRWAGQSAFDLFGNADSFATDTLIALGVATHVVGIAGLVARVAVPKAIRRLATNASLCTFPIYLFHYPALYFFTAVFDSFSGHRPGVPIAVCSLAVGVVATMPCERLRAALRGLLTTRVFASQVR